MQFFPKRNVSNMISQPEDLWYGRSPTLVGDFDLSGLTDPSQITTSPYIVPSGKRVIVRVCSFSMVCATSPTYTDNPEFGIKINIQGGGLQDYIQIHVPRLAVGECYDRQVYPGITLHYGDTIYTYCDGNVTAGTLYGFSSYLLDRYDV